MSKYCPDIQCDFWEDFPDGLPGKKLKRCPFCSEVLITEKPVIDPQQEADIFEDAKSEEISKSISEPGDSFVIIDQPLLHLPTSATPSETELLKDNLLQNDNSSLISKPALSDEPNLPDNEITDTSETGAFKPIQQSDNQGGTDASKPIPQSDNQGKPSDIESADTSETGASKPIPQSDNQGGTDASKPIQQSDNQGGTDASKPILQSDNQGKASDIENAHTSETGASKPIQQSDNQGGTDASKPILQSDNQGRASDIENAHTSETGASKLIQQSDNQGGTDASKPIQQSDNQGGTDASKPILQSDNQGRASDIENAHTSETGASKLIQQSDNQGGTDASKPIQQSDNQGGTDASKPILQSDNQGRASDIENAHTSETGASKLIQQSDNQGGTDASKPIQQSDNQGGTDASKPILQSDNQGRASDIENAHTSETGASKLIQQFDNQGGTDASKPILQSDNQGRASDIENAHTSETGASKLIQQSDNQGGTDASKPILQSDNQGKASDIENAHTSETDASKPIQQSDNQGGTDASKPILQSDNQGRASDIENAYTSETGDCRRIPPSGDQGKPSGKAYIPKNASSTDKSHPEKRKRDNDRASEMPEENYEARKSKKVEEKQKKQPSQPDILIVMNPDETEYVNIQFNTLILKEYWKKIDAICLRIGHTYFHGFQTSIVRFAKTGKFKIKNYDIINISGNLKFPTKLFTKELYFPYKYYIYSSDKNQGYEHLHHNYDYNRFFIWNINQQPLQAFNNNTYQQFDMMILPEIRKKGTFWGYTLPWGEKDTPFRDITDRRLVSLQALLPSYLGCGYSQPCQDLGYFLAQFTCLVKTLMYTRIQRLYANVFRYWDPYDNTIPKQSVILVELWIMTIFDNTVQLDAKSKMYRFYLACYLIQHYKLNNYGLNMKLFNFIEESIEPILSTQSYMFDDSISDHTKFGIEIHTSVIEFLFLNLMKCKSPEMLLPLIPIYHGISNLQEHSTALHQELKYENNEYWGFPADIELYCQDNILFNSKELQKALALVKYDTILPYTIAIYSLNEANAKKMCNYFINNSKNFPLSAIMSVLLFRLIHATNYYDRKFDNLITEVMNSFNTVYTSKSHNLDVNNINRLNKLTLTFALKLPKYYFNTEKFELCLSLICQGLTYCDTHLKDTSLISPKDLRDLFHIFVIKWYGDNVPRSNDRYTDFLQEVQFWEDFIFKYAFPPSTKWFDIVETFLVNRYSDQKISQQYIIDLFIYLHEKGKYSPLLQEIFLKELSRRLQMVKSTDKEWFIKRLYNSLVNTGQLGKVINIFSKILLDEETNFNKSPIQHFVSWTSWDTFFALIDFDDIDHILTKEARDFLDKALVAYSSLFQDIHDFSVQLADLNLININSEHFSKLTEVFQRSKSRSEHTIQDIHQELESCLTMSKWVIEQRKLLTHFHNFIERLHNINIGIISDFLAQNFEGEQIKDICIAKDNSFIFANSPEINDVIIFPQFEDICRTSISLQNSKIVLNVFQKLINDTGGKFLAQFSMDIFYQEIWIPALDISTNILANLSSETIIISEMCKFFDSSKDFDTILNDLYHLHTGCKQYQNDLNEFNKDIYIPCVGKIVLYFNLQQYSEAANLIFKLRDVLSLVSNFDIIKDMTNIKCTYENKQLKEVDDKVGIIAIDLGKLSASNLKVIQTIIDRIEFIKWTRKNMKDLNELKTFIDISLTTCGGNPVDIDRITCLSSVCTNFAPLIFQVDENTSYETLIARCKQVIESVERNKELTELLRQVGENVTFWEEMKQSHGSVEETTLMQLDSIIKSGVLCLKVGDHGDSLKVSDVVSLSVDRENDEKRIYTLEQLREFRSKLMLVVSKFEQPGLNAHTDSYENSQLFTHKLDTITEIATIVIKLAESGNQSYLKYEIFNDVVDVEDDLNETKLKLKSTLDSWRTKVEEARNAYYFLNYYTISQIVSLQNGTRSFIEDGGEMELEQLYHLLRLLNHEVTKEAIQEALEIADICPKHKLNTRVTSKTARDFSKQSLSSAISTQYSHIGPAKLRTIPHPISVFNPSEAEVDDFPEHLSKMETELATEVSVSGGLLLKLAIDGIMEMKKDKHSVLSEKSLLDWCMEHELDSDTKSIDGEPLLDSDAESLPISISHTESNAVATSHTESTFIDFYQLSRFLEEIFQSCGAKMKAERQLPYNMKSGTPNLVVIPSEGIFEFVISLYLSDNDKLPLPYFHEILICTPQTKLEEIEIFWRRALMIPAKLNMYLFCILGVENLHYDVAVSAVSRLKFHQQQQRMKGTDSIHDYKLVIVCSEEKEEFSYMAAAFEDCKIPILTRSKSEDVKRYIHQRLSPVLRRDIHQSRESAWEVDKERSRVRLVVSDSVGAGKSLFIQKLYLDMLSQRVVHEDEIKQATITVAIHGKQASEEHLAEQLLIRNICGVAHGVMFHVDIASTVQWGLEPILFKLLVLGGISKSTGEFWHCRHKDYYVVEITLTSDQNALAKFSQLFPNVKCVQPSDALGITANIGTQTIDLDELRSEQYQRVNAYLKRLETGLNLDTFVFQPSETYDRVGHIDCLNRSLKYCGIAQPSWSEVRNFTSFLNKQLTDCDNSDYCQSGVMGKEWKGFKSFIVRFMLHMSRDFATPSLVSYSEIDPKDLSKFEIQNKRRWENNSHPYIFFNPDGHTLTFLGFHISKQGHLLDSDNPSIVIENNIMHRNLFQILTDNGVMLQENYHKLDKMQKILKLGGVMNISWLADPDPGYVLTLDNTRKILAILMRFRCNIPVVIMGETGCGKTRLIQFMCSLQALQTGATNMLILKVHGGTTEKDVMTKVEEAEVLAMKNFREHDIDTVLFFDEANTSPAIGLIKEIMCDRRMYGRHIRSDIRLQFIAACNPYRRHTKEMLNKLSTAGLGFFTKASEATDRLGDIPLRELVYRVMELPASLRPLVWDFGQLSNHIEKTYTREIVAKHLRDHNSPIQTRGDTVDVISNILAGAQCYMRERKDECSFVSLRDIERAMRVMLWFFDVLDYFQPDGTMSEYEYQGNANSDDNSSDSEVSLQLDSHEDDFQNLIHIHDILPVPMIVTKSNLQMKSINQIDYITYSLILSLAVCYRAKLQEREEFDIQIVGLFQHPLTPINDHLIIHEEVDRCQKLILNEMTVGANIAKNNALKENVFMMFVCIELKIPLFVIGKPGSSKSLAKSIISNSMQGRRCPDGSILQNFKQIQIMSYQCSQLSTAEGIIGVFKSCKNLQRKTGSNKFAACVVLDEVGLAEDSPLLPLKVLHPLLEDNDYGSVEIEKMPEPDELMTKEIHIPVCEEEKLRNIEFDDMKDRVAFIGISNWSLDPAKMNRGIMVARGDPDVEELNASARGICESKNNKESIHNNIDKKIPELAKAYHHLTTGAVSTIDGKRRDYYGLRDFYSLIKMLVFICNETDSHLNRAILEHAVKRNFGGVSDVNPVTVFDDKVKLPRDDKKGPDSSPLGLIRANLTNLSRSYHGETRYLLLLTENYAALNILLRSPDMWPKQQDIRNIRVIFGSSFPCDQEYSAVCLNINRIKVCMESGKTIILLNLENLYESLYDALNQYYMELNNQRYVDLGLGTHRMKCRVHNEFKLIVVADTKTVQERFPTPLINRLEKHFLTMSTVLCETGVFISSDLTEWARKFSALDKDHSIGFQRSVGDCFIGYHNDTPSSIVFHVMKEMYQDDTTFDSDIDRNAVFERSQTLLLRMATTDAVIRVKNSSLVYQSSQIITAYFKLHLSSLEEYLRHVLASISIDITGAHLTLATTHSRLLTERDVDQLKLRLSTDSDTDTIEITSLSLQQFQTEQQYSREIQKFLRGETEIETKEGIHKKILLVQCERGADNAKLIACARHKAVDELKDWREEKGEYKFEVFLVFLIQLSREAHGSKFISFCGGDWNIVHIDDIRSLDYTELPPISDLIEKQIYQLFEGYETGLETSHSMSQKKKLSACIQSAASKLDDNDGSEDRIFDRIRDFALLLTDDKYYVNDFIKTLSQRLTNLLREQANSSIDTNTDWLLQTANCGEDIRSSGTFRKAVNLHINSTITPLIAELIACIDRNGNLELALYNEEVPECMFNLWHDIFRDERLLVLQYKDTISPNTLLPRRRVPVLSDGAGGEYFKAHFPFSWLINQFTSQMLSKTRKLADGSGGCLWQHFEATFYKTPLGEKILHNLMTNETDPQFVLFYLRDFIYMKIFPLNQDQYEIYEYVLLYYIQNISSQIKSEEGETVSSKDKPSIPSIHCAYEDSKQLLEFLQKAFALEKVLEKKFIKVISEMEKNVDKRLKYLELVLLEEIITLCSHKKERTAGEELAEKYVCEIKQWQPLMERGLSINPTDEFGDELQLTIRNKWNRILAVQLFISHCTLKVGFNVTESSINRLFMILEECPDFTSAKVINSVIKILSNCLKKMSKAIGAPALNRQRFKEQATRFFICILTDLTFKYLKIGDRNEDLICLLMGFVTLDEESISQLVSDQENMNIFKKDGLDPSPAFRTLLLQLLIRHRPDVFRENISAYLRNTVYKYQNHLMQKDLYLLIVQSIEDSLHQRFRQDSPPNQLKSFHSIFNNITIRYLADTQLSYELLEKIATLRFICLHISRWIIECFDLLNTHPDTPHDIFRDEQRLITIFQDICLMDGFEDLHTLLLKNIYHQLGSDTLNILTKNPACSWVVPNRVREKIAELPAIIPDYFIIYGEVYVRITSAVELVNLLQKKDALLQFINSETPEANITECLVYSMFQEVIKFFLIQQNDQAQTLFEKFLTLKDFMNSDLKEINPELNNLVIQITTNNFGDGNLPNLKLTDTSSNHELFLIRLIYHAAVMLSCKKYHKLFLPIALIYENPQTLQDRLFPTMMDDQFNSAKAAIGESGNWYQCPNGHPYFIGYCGEAQEEFTCADCGRRVGGNDYVLVAQNVLLEKAKDETRTGYLLGNANDARNVSSGERELSPASVRIIRILMDISFIWSSCSKHPTDRSPLLPSLIKGGLDDPRDLPNFFYLHLEREIEYLTRLTGKNFEEVIFFIHLIIKSVMETVGEPCGIPTDLTQRELREQWEREFDKKFIQTILNSLNTDVQRQMEQVLSEKGIANNPLLRMVYERDESEPNNPLPHLWRYRTIVSLEHFSQSFSTANLNAKNKCPLVDKFLKEENKLFVTRYLPDIVQLQRRVGDKFLHRLDRREAANTSIKDFLNRMKTENKHESEELASLVESLATAWSMIGEDVKKNGRLTFDEALEQQEITPAKSLAYLLPSSTGKGVLITSLTDYLVLIHNSFVHVYRDRVKGSRSNKIPLRELNISHVIVYEEDLQPLLLSHAHYSLALGQGSQVTYDFEGVEQQLMEQFIQNKPLIQAEHLRFEYIREAYNLGVFEQVRHKVQQTEVKEIVWIAIREDLDSLEAISDVLLLLDVVIGFLSSVGGDPEQKLSIYLYEVLKYTHDSHGSGPLQSRRAETVLYLKHIISFWTLLSIEKARKLSLLGQIPFSSLRDEFQEVVSKEEAQQITRTCDKFPVAKILMYLHEFILFFLRERDVDEKNFGLKDSIKIYADDNDWKLPEGFNHFPEVIKLSQCASAWAVLAQEEHRVSNPLANHNE
ncbi:E3 ubiquitin-protein ligase [Oopsacas minuta]|uniref:E3 ubiquitin-protein ligase n=1 Tax=Oopsacas minuta TaxID=111878 RepID=A0AAV7JF03_9METZ|nr:E3 ubiquitin-protein ligase [Oopsacas minuta]